MLEKNYIKILRRAGTAITCCGLAAAALAGGADSKKMGYRPVARDEVATVTLLAQRIATGISSGDPYLYLNFLAKDYADDAASPNQKTPGPREAAQQEVSALRPAVQVSTFRLEQLTVSDHEASCAMVIKAHDNLDLRATLQFQKQGEMWVLAKSNGLGRMAQAHATWPGQSLSKAGGGISAGGASAGQNEAAAHTFIAQPLSAEHQIDRLTRSFTRERLHRSLFSLPYGSAFFARVQQYDSAPFIAASYVQLVTDPAWNRIVYGDYQKWIKAYDGAGSGAHLHRPHGIAADANGFVYVADTGNRRVLVLKLSGPADELVLVYAGTLNQQELSQPMEVAWDDRGTIFSREDDVIWVFDRGTNALLAYRALEFSAAPLLRYQSEQWVAPAALALGRFDGRSDGNIYLADAGTRQLHRFYFDGQTLVAVHGVAGGAEMVPASLATDHWGNVYLADASQRQLQKYSPNLTLLATLQAEDGAFQPARFQPLFGSIALSGQPEPAWSGYDQAFLLEQWSENSGGRRFELGIDFAIEDLRLSADLSSLAVHGKLTDAGHFKTELVAESSGEVIRTLHENWSNAGAIRLDYDRRNAADELIAPGYYLLRHTLQSTYDKPQLVRESRPFYLPLYYYEDCGATPSRDAHLLRGTRHTYAGTEPARSVASDPQAVIYRFTGLNAALAYEVKATFFAAAGAVEQALYGEQNLLHHAKLPPAEALATAWLAIPAEAVVDGQLDLRIIKTGGSGEASVAEIWLREANFDADHPPQPDQKPAAVPRQFVLEQNYPNPFNPTTTIAFTLPEAFQGEVTLRIYNMLGEVVRELVQRNLTAGSYREMWDGRDTSGRHVASGVYVYQLRADSFSATRKLVLMK